MAHLELEKVKDVSAFRKIAIGTWRTAYDPSVYGTMEVEMDRAMDYLARFRDATGLRVTVSHLMAKAMAAALERTPDMNAILRWSRIYRRKQIGVFFQVAMTDEGEDKIDLSGACLYDVEKKDLATIVAEFEEKVDKVRKRQDPALEKTRQGFKRMPFFLMHKLLKLVSFFQYTLNIPLPGVPRDPFGSIMITNIGSLGLDMAYVPLVPYSRVPILLAVGAVKAVPVVRDGEVVVRQMMKVNATFDHRFIDGYHAAVMSKVVHRFFSDPEKYFGPIPAGVALPAPAASGEARAVNPLAGLAE
ncbi:MAG: 2-oxo acid dehydrogenase subunit E2 [Myxococcales bacterium]|nr:2-oxo acid dehydrogenase subunit E2 [Myxococcales bacterium]MCB9733738.1 2-oxo acid dehydrogenase subunit E2 [Deltaproteobacteria bacterium]